MTMSRDDGDREARAAGADPLEAFLAAARATAPEPSTDLMARVRADAARAAAAMERGGAMARPARGRIQRPAIRWRATGAGALAAGLAAAALGGLWLGLAGPDVVATLETALWGADPLLALGADLDLLLAELGSDPEEGS